MALTPLAPILTAVHDDGYFELGPGKATDESGRTNILGDGDAANGPDWNDIFNADGSNKSLAPYGGLAASFLKDDTSQSGSTDRTTFSGAGGSNKNNDKIAPPGDTWHWDEGNVPAKDDLVNVYAYATVPTSGQFANHLIIYAGFERLDPSGDSHVDVELFQDQIGLDGRNNATGLCQNNTVDRDNGCHFSGAREIGDVIVSMDFKVGGSFGSMTVREWLGSSYGAPIVTLTGEGCNTADTACAFNNGGPIDGGAWPNYDRHGAVITTLPTNAFTEFGLDVQGLIGNRPCLTSIMGKTRSSQSFTAELKDFAGPQPFDVCKLSIEKTGPELSKTGDTAVFTFTIRNNGTATLYKQSIVDDVIGILELSNPEVISSTCGASLGPHSSCTIVAEHVITPTEGAQDTLTNKVTATYKANADLTGVAKVVTDTHVTHLFHPAIDVTKSGPTLSKVGDAVTYTIMVCNVGSANSPALIPVSVVDNVLGDLTSSFTESLGPTDCETHTFDYTIQPSDPDPLVNVVEVHYHPDGFPNDITDRAQWSINLFQPAITLTKTGPRLSKAGDEVVYTIQVCNIGSSDSPILILDSVADTILGSLTSSFASSLASGVCESHDFPYTIQIGDPDPLDNTVTVHYHPLGFPNDITARASWSVNLFQPAVIVYKSANVDLSKVGDTILYTITVCSIGSSDSPDLVAISVFDSLLGDKTADFTQSLAPFGPCESHTYAYTVQPADPDPLVNTVTVHYHPVGFSNNLMATASATVNLFQPGLTVTKTGPTLSKVGDTVVYTVEVCNTGSTDAPDLVLDRAIDSLVGDVSGLLSPTLPSGVCETITYAFTIPSGSPDPLVNTIEIHYHPDGFENDITDSSRWLVNLFTPGITVDKTGSSLSKVGDTVTYRVEVCNVGSADSPVLILDSAVDTLVDVTGLFALSLAPGACDIVTYDYIVQAGDRDPLVNTITVHYHPDGFTNDIFGSDSWSVNLFTVGITVEKFGPELSKVGDTVTYTVRVCNVGSDDSPDLILVSATDSLVDVTGLFSPTLGHGVCETVTYTYLIPPGSPDPLVNTIELLYHPEGFDNRVFGSSRWVVELFQPRITVDKTGPSLSKVGDTVTYRVEVCNVGSADSPVLILDSAVDTLVDVTGLFSASLAPGTCDVVSYDYVVRAGDPDPLVNTITVHYHPNGFTNDIFGSDSWSVNLFTPGVTVTKTGPTLSKAGDEIVYTITVCNTGSSDTPDLILDSFSDSLLGSLSPPFSASLAPGACETFDFPYTVQPGDPDPLVNIVEVHYHPFGFTNDIADRDSWSVNLFQPRVSVTKTGPTLSKAGDVVRYTITVCNIGSLDSPPILPNSVFDDVLGDLTASFTQSLVPIACETHSFDYTIQPGDPDPLVNIVEVHYHPFGFPNDLTARDSWSVNLFQPAVIVEKTSDVTLSKVGDAIVYTIQVCNAGSADSPDIVAISVMDSLLGDKTADFTMSLAPGECETHSYRYVVREGDADPLVNIVEVHYHPEGFDNNLMATDFATVNLFQPHVSVTKTGPELSKAGDTVTYTIRVCDDGSGDSPDLMLDSFADSLLGDLSGSFSASLAPGTCETRTFPYTVQPNDPDPLVNIVEVHYHPLGFKNDIADRDSWTVNLFQPRVTVTKSGPTLSKIGDTVTYTIQICNTGSDDSPALIPNLVDDSLLGDLTASFTQSLAPTDCETHSFDYTVQPGDPDPLVNIVEVHYHPFGFTNDIADRDSWTVNLFQPLVSVTKRGPELSKAGDTVTYTIRVCNDGSFDSPDLVATSVFDSLLGDKTSDFTQSLAPGECETHSYPYTVQGTDPDPLVNTVEVHYRPVGFPNDLMARASWIVNLFQPGVLVAKTGPEFSKVGDTAVYHIRVCNVGSSDSPDLILDSFLDSLLGPLSPPFSTSLAPGACESFDFSYVVQPTDTSPLVNTVEVHYHPLGFTNDITSSASWTTILLQPALSVTKTGSAFGKTGDTIDYVITIRNEGDVGLMLVSIEDPLIGELLVPDECRFLDVGASCTIFASHTVTPDEGAGDSLTNTVFVVYQIDPATGLDNRFPREASFTTTLLHPRFAVTKECTGTAAIGDTITYAIGIVNTGDVSLNFHLVQDSLLGDITGTFPASLGIGSTVEVTPQRVVLANDPDTLTNTVSVDMQIDPETGLTNHILGESTCYTQITRPFVKLTLFGFSNEPTDTVHGDGLGSGIATYTMTLKNFGTADALVYGSLAVSASNLGGGSIACSTSSPDTTLVGCTLSWSGIALAPGESVTLVLEVTYTDIPAGSTITADFASTYTPLNGALTFDTAGSPASVSFTVRDSP